LGDDFRLEELASHHKRELFRCASTSIEEYLRTLARKQDRNDSTRVHVYANEQGRIAGYFTLSAATLELRDLPEEIQRGRPKFPLPATLLGRFGVDRDFENRGLGSLLLGLALLNACTASKLVASAAIVLTIANDASEQASALYRKYGFSPLPSNANQMILMMSVVRGNLDREDRLE
jgi:GNAT superfamily N-acetyltransferase